MASEVETTILEYSEEYGEGGVVSRVKVISQAEVGADHHHPDAAGTTQGTFVLKATAVEGADADLSIHRFVENDQPSLESYAIPVLVESIDAIRLRGHTVDVGRLAEIGPDPTKSVMDTGANSLTDVSDDTDISDVPDEPDSTDNSPVDGDEEGDDHQDADTHTEAPPASSDPSAVGDGGVATASPPESDLEVDDDRQGTDVDDQDETGGQDDVDLDDLDPDSEEDLQAAYDAEDGNIKQASEHFDLTYGTIYSRMREFGVHSVDGDEPDGSDDQDVDDVDEESEDGADDGRDPKEIYAQTEVDGRITFDDFVSTAQKARSPHDLSNKLRVSRGDVKAALWKLNLEPDTGSFPASDNHQRCEELLQGNLPGGDR